MEDCVASSVLYAVYVEAVDFDATKEKRGEKDLNDERVDVLELVEEVVGITFPTASMRCDSEHTGVKNSSSASIIITHAILNI